MNKAKEQAFHLRDVLTEEQESLLKKQHKFKYESDSDGVKVYDFDGKVGIDPLIYMSYGEMEEEEISNMPEGIYCYIDPDATLEQKAACYMLKELASFQIIGTRDSTIYNMDLEEEALCSICFGPR